MKVQVMANEPPEEQIKRDPKLAFDDPEPAPSHDEIITELLRWFHRPEDAGGMTIYIPKDHPCGLGRSTLYIPKRLASPSSQAAASRMPPTHSSTPESQRDPASHRDQR